MNKIKLINFFFQQREYKRYLEIGVSDNQMAINLVCCGQKASILAHFSDIFFENNQIKFDLVFIDGIHTEDQVLKDVANSLRFLEYGGIIILHNCMPANEWHQREASEFVDRVGWNGTVWRAALRIFNSVEYKCTLIDVEAGIAIIDTSRNQPPLFRALPAQLVYDQHYPLLLDYKCSVAYYLRTFVRVFFHVACMNNWKSVFEEILQQLHHNGFNYISLTVLGSDEDLESIYATSKSLNMVIVVVFHENNLANYEKPAILAIENFAHQYDAYVLYIHTKGVSGPNDATKAQWRRLMLAELIDNWELCVTNLADYDIIGVNWREMPPISHFCGNFWYASTQYLRRLKDFKYYYDNPRYQIWDAIHSKRLGCEFWMGSAEEKPKVLSLVCKNVDFCNHAYWADKK